MDRQIRRKGRRSKLRNTTHAESIVQQTIFCSRGEGRKEGRLGSLSPSFSHSDFECYLRECKWIVAKMCKQRDRYARCCCGRRDPNLICGYIEERKSQSSRHDMNMLINNLLNSEDMLKGSSHQRVGDLRYVKG